MRAKTFLLFFWLFLASISPVYANHQLILPNTSYSLVASPSSVAPSETITLTWSAPLKRAGHTQDWIALYRVGDANTNYGERYYTSGATNGKFTYTAPTAAGDYEFRYLLDNNTLGATSNPVTVSLGAPPPSPPPSAQLEVIAFTNYPNQPDFTPYGVGNGWMGPGPVRMNWLIPDNDFGGAECNNYPLPSESTVKDHFQTQLVAGFNGLVFINLECWWPPSSRLNDYITLFGWYKQVLGPNAKLAYYGPMPAASSYEATAAGPNDPLYGPIYQQWVADNNAMQPLADVVDFFVFDLYPVSPDQTMWAATATAYINEAKRLGNGKPVYPFLSPRYAPYAYDGLAWQTVPKDYFRFQLDTLKAAGADGVVVWEFTEQQWSEDLPWWQATKEFLGLE